MISITCPECGTRLKAPENRRGRTFKCPKCESPIKVEPLEPASSPPPEFSMDLPAPEEEDDVPIDKIVPPPPVRKKRRTESRSVFRQVIDMLILIGTVVLVLVALVGFGVLYLRFAFSAEYSSHRFKSDNAVGATANAVEYIAWCGWMLMLFAGAIIGLLFRQARQLSAIHEALTEDRRRED